jgi:nucleoid-associated protein
LNTINAAVLHKLVKERQGKASIVTRSELLQVTPPVEKLVHDIHALYSERTNKGYGRFEEDETNYPSSRILREVFKDGRKAFLEGSCELMTVLAAKAGQVPLATGGYVLMTHLANSAKASWFIVAMITNIRGSTINDASLEVVESTHVDTQNLRVAGRVNLTDWLSDEKDVRYIGFLKQRGDVSDYFKLFLGCNELIASTEETKKLVVVLKDFAKKSGLSRARQEEFLRSAYEHCSKCQKNDQPLNLEVLTNAIWSKEPKVLQRELTAGNVQINDGFVPDRRCLKAFVKIKARTPYWSVEIDRQALVSGQAKYDALKRTLTLTDLPGELEAELKSELDDGPV